ncbi:MAG TPA: helix-turn-helix transcriptional regulator, partial [Pilimelia sp.]|nr:helix-turn-helix transcriptional regulator [Pilimelia sp.]
SHGVSGGALTPRQRQVVGWVATAATDQQIGRALGISGRTVGKHLENVYRKLGLSGRAELIAASAPPTRRQLSQAG